MKASQRGTGARREDVLRRAADFDSGIDGSEVAWPARTEVRCNAEGIEYGKTVFAWRQACDSRPP